MVKSVVLVLWLLLPGGRQEFLLAKHVDSHAQCQALAQTLSDARAAKGQRVRHICEDVVEEVGGVDVNGNPLPSGHE